MSISEKGNLIVERLCFFLALIVTLFFLLKFSAEELNFRLLPYFIAMFLCKFVYKVIPVLYKLLFYAFKHKKRTYCFKFINYCL